MIAPNAARLVVTPEDALEFGKELGAGAFGTVYEVRRDELGHKQMRRLCMYALTVKHH